MIKRNVIVGSRCRQVDLERLRQLWEDGTLTVLQIAIALRVGSPAVYKAARSIGLPSRRTLKGRECFHPTEDPTPEEIAQRAAEQRALRGPGWLMR